MVWEIKQFYGDVVTTCKYAVIYTAFLGLKILCDLVLFEKFIH